MNISNSKNKLDPFHYHIKNHVTSKDTFWLYINTA